MKELSEASLTSKLKRTISKCAKSKKQHNKNHRYKNYRN